MLTYLKKITKLFFLVFAPTKKQKIKKLIRRSYFEFQ